MRLDALSHELLECILQRVRGALCEGTWHAGEMVGFGRRIYASGEEYAGEFAAGLRHGS